MESESVEDWVESAIKPFGDNSELELKSRAVLLERFGDSSDRAMPRLTGRPRVIWLILVVVALALAPVVWMASKDTNMILRVMNANGLIDWFGYSGPMDSNLLHVKGLAAEDAEFLVGDLQVADEVDRWRAVLDDYPDDPAILADFMGKWLGQRGRIPDELFDRALELDPGNAWYDLLRGGMAADGAVEQASGTAGFGPHDLEKPTEWVIHDPGAMEESIRSMKRASLEDRVEDWFLPLAARRLERLPKVTNAASSARRMSYLSHLPAPAILPIRHLVDVIGAEAERCAEEGDVDGLRDLIQAHTQVSRLILDKEGTLIDSLVTNVFLRNPLANFRDAGEKLGLSENELANLNCRIAEHVRLKKRKNPSLADYEFEEWVEQKASWLFAQSAPMVSRQVEHPPVIGEEDVRPGRRGDHAMIGRGLAVVGSLLLLVIVLIWWKIAAVFSGKFFAILGRSLSRGFTWGDAAAVALIGGLFPVLLFLAWRFLTPYGGLAWSIKLTFLPVEVVHFSLTILLIFWSSRFAARWAVERRFGAIPRNGFVRSLPWIAGACLILAYPTFGCWTPDRATEFFWVGIVLVSIALVLLIVDGVLNRKTHVVDRLLERERAMIGMVSGGLGLLIAGCGLQIEERRWHERERMMVVNEEHPAFGFFETKVAEQVRTELRAILDRCDGED